MKQTVQMNQIQENMRPGKITLEGFLGSDERHLVDILIEDDNAVKSLALNHQQIATRMIQLRDLGMAGLGEFVTIEGHFEVRVDSVRGKIPCPFGDPGIFPKTNTTVRNLILEKEITYTDLQIHMIWAHGFYEGKGHHYRLDPEFLKEVLEIPGLE